jgi:cytochrome c553
LSPRGRGAPSGCGPRVRHRAAPALPAAAGGPLGAPILAGQRAAYLAQQLTFFKTGERSNDIDSQMRDIAGKLTDMEIENVAGYYATMR